MVNHRTLAPSMTQKCGPNKNEKHDEQMLEQLPLATTRAGKINKTKMENKNSGKLPVPILLSRLGAAKAVTRETAVGVIVIHRHMCGVVCVFRMLHKQNS